MRTRRSFLGLATGAALAAAIPGGIAAAAAPGATGRLRELERAHGARLGVYGRNLGTGRTVAYRADELFPLCSSWKPLVSAAILRDLDQHGEVLAKRIHYTQADLVTYSPITGTPEHLANGMTIAELSAASICYSDNSAANFLLREIGGPTGITRFCRSIGDHRTRLDRWETELNTAEPWRITDTTSPRAIAGTYRRVLLGDALTAPDRQRVTDWMLANTTSGDRFRAGLPKDWKLADKTGTGSYGTNNDVGIAWTPAGTPILLAVYTTKPEQAAKPDSPLVAKAAAVLADTLG
ncbi:beta-lactamase class A [Crossiella cryophila]|uniref:Beta-lactamase n=1 Tax=Crossiella cryophila TaxID=43355 RepID=A0A7W7FVG5_9PSEU|nr:beta-lactamase class A [Crossiella cryophila]